jgi:Right handed beta helix region
MTPRLVVRGLVSAEAALILFAVSCGEHPASATGLATSYVAPGGSGNCTRTSPCGSIDLALRGQSAGGTILLASGSYPTQVIHDTGGRAAHFASNVTIEPASAANPVLASIVDYAPHLTFSHLRVDARSSGFSSGYGGVNITSQADHSQIVNSHLTDATLSLSSSDVAAVGNEIGPSQNYDGIDVGNGASGVLISRNHIHDLTVGLSNPNNVHVDCVQIYDSTNLTVTSNWLDNCTDRDLIFSPGRRLGVTNVIVENNFIRGCVIDPCQGSGYVVDARTAPGIWNLTNLSFVSNTVVDGSTLIAANDPGLIFRDNIISFLGNCMNVSDHNLVAAYNRGLCKDPAFLGATNVLQGLPKFVNVASGDLHLTKGDSNLRFALQKAQPSTDIDGLRRCQPSYVGAHDFCAHTLGSVAPPPRRPSSPAQKVTNPKSVGVPRVATRTAGPVNGGAPWLLLGVLVVVTMAIVIEFRVRLGRWPW